MIRDLAAIMFIAIASPALTSSAVAQGQVTVDMPDLSGMSEADAERLIAALAQINVITSNCPDYRVTDGEWTLLTGTGDMLAARLGIDPASYDRNYFAPAFETLEDPGACDRIGPKARPIIDDLIAMGGSTDPSQ
ncbi:hypothetical protein [Paracoccus aerodenitrificans]|uniref:hypothetical protein n=1 Tax=Paracoccus aerodenitrificans TaxID=3017781 RepID=UPI0022EFFB41|nr:hypothetical protein [Paracoccus aerodenitrificans]WBU64263.1 hypothetical protein PAE61_02070 [Paracoccus aerodenitrificans]